MGYGSQKRVRVRGGISTSTLLVGSWYQFWANETIPRQSGTHSTQTSNGSREYIADSTNPLWRKRKNAKSDPFDYGCDLTHFRGTIEGNIKGRQRYTYPGWGGWPQMRFVYDGGWIPWNWGATYAGYFTAADLANVGESGKFSGYYGDPSGLGPQAWNQYKPKLSSVDLGQFVGESREIPRMLKTSAYGFADVFRQTFGNLTSPDMGKKLGNQWLNTQFGWRPFINDLSGALRTAREGHSTLSRLIQHNNHWLKRKGPIGFQDTNAAPKLVASYKEESHTGNPWIFPAGVVPSLAWPSGRDSSTNIYGEETVRSWFSGAFKYWVPSFDNPDDGLNKVSNYLRLYGLRMNPLLIWNLTPWSWMIDWFSNVGDNIANYSAISQDSMAAKYAYVMQERVIRLTNESTLNLSPVVGGTIHLTWRSEAVTQQRRHASPFGFTIDWPDFSAFQWSILAALGFSRIRTS